MKELLKKTDLEHLLRSNWSTFIDKTKLLAFLLQEVRDADFPIASRTSAKLQKGYKITLSRLELIEKGFLLWIDFDVPISADKRCIGTSETILTNTGTLHPRDTIGQVYVIN